MLRLSKLTDYAVVVLVRLSSGSDGVQTSPGIAAADSDLSTLATVGSGMPVAAAMLVAEVIAAVDGPIALTACVEGSSSGCEAEHLCPMRGRWDPVNDAIKDALSAISLADMRDATVRRMFGVPLPAAQIQPSMPAPLPVPVTVPAQLPAAE
jgi:DNA-binding IscR family transcriptional regulator